MSSGLEKEVLDFLGEQGPLARLLDRYEYRPEQGKMAAAVLRSLSDSSRLIVEAGTGTGKTLAYLAPALYSSRRVVISTGTKALQEQLLSKDLPVLAREFELKAAIMKGRNNYLCRRRHREFGQAPMFRFREEIPVYERVRAWAERTESGDRAEIKGLPDDYAGWRELSATGEQCLGQKCVFFRDCFITRMRAAAQEAQIVVVNHHLFFADLAVRSDSPGQVIPSYQTVIFDEAHGLAEAAIEYFGVQVSTWRLADLGQDIRRLQRVGRMPVELLRTMLKALDKAEHTGAEVLAAVAEAGRGLDSGKEGDGRRFSLAPLRSDRGLRKRGDQAAADLEFLASSLTRLADQDPGVASLAERALALAKNLSFILAQEDSDHVFWAETRGRGVIMKASPIELGPVLEERLFSKPIPLIFTSATLAVKTGEQWSFDHFKSELGLGSASGGSAETGPARPVHELWLASSYNWPKQAMLYLPRDLPDPAAADFPARAAAEMEAIVRISRGRAFLLFTSYRNLELAHEFLKPRLPFRVLKQGDAPKSELLDEFRRHGSAVLLATQSFWQGVDVAGSALSCVVIDKLPFDSPGDPLVAARIERIRKRKGNPFLEYQLPAAVLALKQGLGRLIRSREDFGILAVLDSRLHRRNYGKTFIQSLPPMPITSALADLEKFFQERE